MGKAWIGQLSERAVLLQQRVVSVCSSCPLMPLTTTNGNEFVSMSGQNASIARFPVAMDPSAGRLTTAPKSIGCKITKVEDAFPRAQLQQDESNGAQKFCLKCCRGRSHHLQCSQCQTTPALPLRQIPTEHGHNAHGMDCL